MKRDKNENRTVFIKTFLMDFADEFAENFAVYSRILQTAIIKVSYRCKDQESDTTIKFMDSEGKDLLYSLARSIYYDKSIKDTYKFLWDNLLSKHKPFLEWLNAHNIKVNKLEDLDILEKERVDLDIRLCEKGVCRIYPTIYGGGLEEVIKYD